MKLCPNCRMITESYGECIVCGHNLTDEPHVEKKCEKYVLNKYFLPYLFKKHRFAVICFFISLAAMLISVKNMGVHSLYTVVAAVMLILTSLFKNGILTITELWYNESYAESRYHWGLYIAGGLSILLSVLTLLGAVAV